MSTKTITAKTWTTANGERVSVTVVEAAPGMPAGWYRCEETKSGDRFITHAQYLSR